MLNAIRTAADRLVHEAVLIGAALLAQYAVTFPNASAAANAAAIAWVAIFQRMLSTSTKSANDRVEQGRYVGAVNEAAPEPWQPPPLPPQPPAPPAP